MERESRLPAAIGVVVVTALATSAGAAGTPPFQLMQIEKIIGGVRGNTSAQAIQLRTRDAGELLMTQARLVAHDMAGQNPIVLASFDHDLPFAEPGTAIFIASADLIGELESPLPPDYAMTPMPPEYMLAGSLTYEDLEGAVYWRLSWGGKAYTGPNDGSCLNDDTPCPFPGDFGPPWHTALPFGGTETLSFVGPAGAPSTSNAADYDITPGPALFENSVGDSSPVAPLPYNDLDGDMIVGITDLLIVLADWGRGGPGDVDGDGITGIGDLLAVLATWGPTPDNNAAYGVECPFGAECVDPELNCRYYITFVYEPVPGACPPQCVVGNELCISPCPPPVHGYCPYGTQQFNIGMHGCVIFADPLAGIPPYICDECDPGACRVLITGPSW